MDPEKQARLEAAGFHVTDDPRDLLNPLAVINELRARVAELEAGIEAAMPCDYKRDGDDLDHSESCRKCALLNR